MIKFIQRHIREIVLGSVVCAVVFGMQSDNIGLYGMPHALISQHMFSMIGHATPENHFVSYSQLWHLAPGQYDYEYFERIPLYFSTFMNTVLSITTDSIPSRMFAARQVMNVFYLATLFCLWWIANRLVEHRWFAAGAVLLASSNFHQLYYKDMVNHDQPTILGMLLLMIAIFRYRSGEAGRRWVVAAGLFAVSFGVGFPAFFTLGLWFVIEVVRTRTVPWRGEPLFVVGVTVLCLMWAGGHLAYNISAEARTRDVSMMETSVVDSAVRRMPFLAFMRDRDVTESTEAEIGLWQAFLTIQVDRMALWLVPFRLAGDMHWTGIQGYQFQWYRVVITAVGAVAAGAFIWRQQGAKRDLALLLVGSGLLFIFVMKDFSFQHIYVTMYSFGFVLAAYLMILSPLRHSQWATRVLLGVSLVTFTVSNWQVRQFQQAESDLAAPFTRDFERVRVSGLVPADDTIYLGHPHAKPECFLRRRMCYAMGFYMPNNAITRNFAVADFVLSPRDYYVSQPLVEAGQTVDVIPRAVLPQNEIVYLMDVNQMEQRTAPEEDNAQFIFGEALTLQHWQLNDDVRVPPCGWVNIESWWLTREQLDKVFQMQIVLVAEDGSALSDANAPLTMAQTNLWEPNRFAWEARSIQVPCDTAAGTYPLIMGVYNPDTLEPLTAHDSTGQPIGNQIYLTSLIVE